VRNRAHMKMDMKNSFADMGIGVLRRHSDTI
jgi:hypothetical protein